MIDDLFGAFPGIPDFINKLHRFAEVHGYVEDVFGRRRWVGNIKALRNDMSKDAGMILKHALNVSHNSTIQSSASIAAWIAVSNVQEELVKRGMESVFIKAVHDSHSIDVYPRELYDVMVIDSYYLVTPPNQEFTWLNGNKLKVDFEIGSSWGYSLEVKKFEDNEYTDYCNLYLEGGNLCFDLLKKELDLAYPAEFLTIKK